MWLLPASLVYDLFWYIRQRVRRKNRGYFPFPNDTVKNAFHFPDRPLARIRPYETQGEGGICTEAGKHDARFAII